MAGFLFRFRSAVMVLLHLIGFLPPWAYFAGGGSSTLWLAASTLVARTGWLSLADVTLTITLLGLLCLVSGTALRVWGTAYLGSYVMLATTLQGGRFVAAGPYAYLRNPLYLGSWLLALATSLLMPPVGAAFFVASYTGFLLFLVAAEEQFLAARLGEPYLRYRREVPRLLPRFPTAIAGEPGQVHWLPAFLNEAYHVGLTLCFAVFAWRYNARLLIRCLLICYGVSLVLRAFNKTTKAVGAPRA